MSNLEICEMCKLPLSITPIWKTVDSARICGRCVQINTNDYTRDIEYEEKASTLKFKCRYFRFGCEEMVEFDAKNHENNCHINCALVKNQHELEQLLSHHKFGGVLENSCVPLQTLERNIHQWYVYNLPPLTFFLHTGLISNRFIFDIGLVDKKNISNDIKYRIILGGQSGTENFLTLAQRTVSTNMRYFPQLYGPNTINHDTVVDLLGDADIYWHIHIVVPKYIYQDNVSNLTAITCPKCNVSMTPPIYKCASNGHVVCEDCAEEKDGVGWCYACPQVKMRFPNNLSNKAKLQQIQRFNKQRVCLSRSESMDNISRWVSPLRCRWPSCDYFTNTIRSHERECKYRIYSCSWWCDYSGTLENLKEHMQKKHQDKSLFSTGEACVNGKEDNKRFVIIFNRDLFTVTMSTTSFGKEFYVCYKTPQKSIKSEYNCTVIIHNFDEKIDGKEFIVPFYKKFDISQEDLDTFNEQTFYISVKITIKVNK